MSTKKKQAKRAKVKKLATRAEQRAVARLVKMPSSTPTAGGVANVSFKDAMKQTGRSMGHIYRCINDGRLPAFKVGRETVFRQSDIDKLLTPVPYTPTAERPYNKTRKAKPARVAPARKRAKGGIVKRAKAALAAVRKRKPAKRAPSLKASVNKALKSMTAAVSPAGAGNA